MEITLIVPFTRNFAYDKDGIFFKERVSRRDTEAGTEYASSQIMYINDSIIMNGLTFLLSKNSSSAISDLERVILKMYAATNIHTNTNNGNENKKMNYLVTNDLLHLNLDLESGSEPDNENHITLTLYVTGVWENATGIGLEYKLVTQLLPVSSETC